MAGIKAGTAYIQIELSGVRNLKKAMNEEVSAAANAAADTASKKLGEKISGTPAAKKIEQDLKSGLSGVVAGSINPFAAKVAQVFESTGAASVARFAGEFGRGISAVSSGGSLKTFFSSMVESAKGVGSDIASSIGRGISASGGYISSAARSAMSGVSEAVQGTLSFVAGIPSAFNRASDAIRKMSSEIGIASRQVQALGVVMSLAFTAPVVGVGVLGAAIGIKFAVQVEDATIALRALLPKGYDVVALIARLQKMAIASPVFDTAAVITFTQQMVAAGISIDKTEKFLKAFGNIAVTAGAPMDKITLALQAFVQMAGKGKVQMEELRQQLGDALPGALKIAADGLGVTQEKLNKMVKDGKVTADQLLDAFIKVGNTSVYTEGAANGADSLRSRWNAMKESFQTNLGNAVLKNMDQIKAAFDKVTPAINRFAEEFIQHFPAAVEFVGKLADKVAESIKWYDGLSNSNKTIVKDLIALLVVGGPVLAVLGTLGTAVAGVAAAFSVLLSPVGLIVIAIVAVVAGAKLLWEWLKNLYVQSGEFQDIVFTIIDSFKTNLLPIFKEVAGTIKESLIKAWEQLRNTFKSVGGDWEGLKTLLQAIEAVLAVLAGIILGLVIGAIKALGPIIQGLASIISGVIKVIVGALNLIYDFFSGRWSKLGSDILMIWNGLWDIVVGTLVNAVKAIWNFISGAVESTIKFFTYLYDVLVGHSIVPDMVNAIISWFQQLPGKILALIINMVMSVIQKFLDFKNYVISSIADLVSSAVSRFMSLASSFVSVANAVKDRVSDVLSTVAGLPGRILNALGNLGGLLYSAGRDVISGLINGITNMAGSLYDKAKGIASTIKDVFSNAMKIGSPSKVMIELGQFAIEGLAIGLSNTDEIARAMTAAADAVRMPVAKSGAQLVTVNHEQAQASSALYIDKYYGVENASPEKQAEAWAFMVRTRGW